MDPGVGLVAVEVDAFRPGRPDMGGGGGGLLVREASGPLLALASGPPSDGLAVRLADPLGLQRRHPAQRRLPFLPHGGADLLGVVLADEPALSPVRNPDPAGPLLVVLGPALELPRVGRLPGPAGLRIDPADHDVHVRVIAVGMAGDESLAAGIAASVEGFEGGGHHLPLRRVLARRPRERQVLERLAELPAGGGHPGGGLEVGGVVHRPLHELATAFSLVDREVDGRSPGHAVGRVLAADVVRDVQHQPCEPGAGAVNDGRHG